MKRNAKLMLLALSIGGIFLGGVSAQATYDEATNTDTLTNQMVSSNRGGAAGDMKSYDHADRNLVINWTDGSRGDGSAIRNAEVTAKNLTVSADFKGDEWTDKGIIDDGDGDATKINVSGDINITANNDAVYTQGNGTVDISGFKNLKITAREGGYGMVDNGGGITVKGGEGSIVDITAEAGMDPRAAIGNSIYSSFPPDPEEGWGPVGTGISIEADTIKLTSESKAIHSGKGKDTKFTVDLKAKDIDIVGTVGAQEGDVFIDGDTVKIFDSLNEDNEYPVNSIHTANGDGTYGTNVVINKDNRENVLVQISGLVDVRTNSKVLVNMTKDGSYLNSLGTSTFARQVIYAQSGGQAEFNITGNDSFIRGDTQAEYEGHVTIKSTGDNFSMSQSFFDKQKWKQPGLMKAESNGIIDISIEGKKGSVEGNIFATRGGEVHLTMSGDDSTLTSGLYTGRKDPFYPATETSGVITVDLSGKNAVMTGHTDEDGTISAIVASGKKSTVTVNLSGENGKLDGDVWVYATENTVNLSLTGANAAHTGNILTKANNTLNASYTGTNSSLTGDVTTAGTTVLEFDNASLWNGNLTTTAGTADISLKNGSIWNGSSTGDGAGGANISLENASLWNVTADSEAGTLSMSDDSIVSLAGDAHHLKVSSLEGSGTFLMDLTYQDDAVATYRDGDGSDFLIADGGSGTYKLSLAPDSSVGTMTTDNKLYFASVAAGTSSFTEDESVEVTNTKKIYNTNLLVKKETDETETEYAGYDNWYLTLDGDKDNTINDNGLVPGSAYSAAFALWRDDDTLLKRLGDLREGEEEGLWARFIYKRLSRDGSDGFKGNYKTLQVGVDKEKTADDGSWYYGGALGYTWGDADYSGGDGKQKVADLSIYATKVDQEGKYLDLVAKFGRIRSDYDTVLGDSGEFTNWGSTISAEYGQKRVMENGWIMEPQIQLAYNYLWGDDYTTKNGAKVEQDNADSLVGRLGIVMSREFMYKTARPSRVYVKASVLHDFLGDTASTIKDDILFTDTDDLGDTWFILGAGTNLHLSDSSQFYFDVERNFNAKVEMKYRLNAGVRFRF